MNTQQISEIGNNYISKSQKNFEQKRDLSKDIESEKIILASILNSPILLKSMMNNLKIEMFSQESNQAIYESIISLFSKSEPIDIWTITYELKRKGNSYIIDNSYLKEIFNTGNQTDNLSIYLKKLVECYVRRLLIIMCNKSLNLGYEYSAKYFEIKDLIKNELSRLKQYNHC